MVKNVNLVEKKRRTLFTLQEAVVKYRDFQLHRWVYLRKKAQLENKVILETVDGMKKPEPEVFWESVSHYGVSEHARIEFEKRVDILMKELKCPKEEIIAFFWNRYKVPLNEKEVVGFLDEETLKENV